MLVMLCAVHDVRVSEKSCNRALASSLPRVNKKILKPPPHSFSGSASLQRNESLTWILPLTKVVISSSLSKMDRVCSKLFSSHSQCFVISLRDDPNWRGQRLWEEQSKKTSEQVSSTKLIITKEWSGHMKYTNCPQVQVIWCTPTLCFSLNVSTATNDNQHRANTSS